MKSGDGWHFRGFVFLISVATATLGIGPSPARAQWGMGMGAALFGGFGMVNSPSQVINDHAMIRAQAGRREPSRNVYSNNSNSYFNRIRDNGFSSHQGTQSHRSPGLEIDRRAARSLSQTSNNVPRPAPAAEADPRPRSEEHTSELQSPC